MSTCEYTWCENPFAPLDHEQEQWHFQDLVATRGQCVISFRLGLNEGTPYLYYSEGGESDWEARPGKPNFVSDMIQAWTEVQRQWDVFRSRYDTVLRRNVEATAALAERDV